jgi:hypothetical protein
MRQIDLPATDSTATRKQGYRPAGKLSKPERKFFSHVPVSGRPIHDTARGVKCLHLIETGPQGLTHLTEKYKPGRKRRKTNRINRAK